MAPTHTAVSVAQAVKQSTTQTHEETEAHLLPVLQNLSSREQYVRLLQMFYGFYTPLEQKISLFVTENNLPDVGQRRQSSLILSDLAALNQAVDDLPLCTNLPLIQSAPAAFGALYVLEGSTLGGKMISRMLAKHPQYPVPSTALRFFNGYGDQTGRMWTEFVSVLNRQQDVETITKAAAETFESLKRWMQQWNLHDANRQ